MADRQFDWRACEDLPAALAEAAEALVSSAVEGPGTPLLRELAYLSDQSERHIGEDPRSLRIELLSLAARCSRLIVLDRAARLFGAVYPPSGPQASSMHSIHAGGRGLSSRQAFESCMGELVERIAVGTTPSFPHLNRQETTRGSAAAISLEKGSEGALLEAVERASIRAWWGSQTRHAAVQDQRSLDRVFAGRPSARRRWLLDISLPGLPPTIAALSSTADGGGIVVAASCSLDPATAAASASMELHQMEYGAAISLRRARISPPDELAPADQLWVDRLEHHSTAAFTCFAPSETAANGAWAHYQGVQDLMDALQEREISVDLRQRGSLINGLVVVEAAISGWTFEEGQDVGAPPPIES